MDRHSESHRTEELAEQAGKAAGELGRERAGRLEDEIGRLSAAAAGLAGGTVLGLFGASLLASATAAALSRRQDSTSSLLWVGATLLALSAGVAITAWGRGSRSVRRIRDEVADDVRAFARGLR